VKLTGLIIGAFCAVLTAAAQNSSPVNPCPDVTGATPGYVIGPLDVLDIRVWGDDKLSGMFPVRPDGMISMPLVGEISAAGFTVAQLNQVITAKRSSDVMFDPVVNINVPKVNSKNFYIEGGVHHTGEFPLQRNLTILDALSGAGGFRDFARKNKIYILRGAQLIKFNYEQVSRGQHMEQNVPVLNGDHIIVPEN
jgi:polysaccharide export outer membrane protein